MSLWGDISSSGGGPATSTGLLGPVFLAQCSSHELAAGCLNPTEFKGQIITEVPLVLFLSVPPPGIFVLSA